MMEVQLVSDQVMHEVKFHLTNQAVVTTSLSDGDVRQMHAVLTKAWHAGEDTAINVTGVNNTTVIRPSQVIIVVIEGWKP